MEEKTQKSGTKLKDDQAMKEQYKLMLNYDMVVFSHDLGLVDAREEPAKKAEQEQK